MRTLADAEHAHRVPDAHPTAGGARQDDERRIADAIELARRFLAAAAERDRTAPRAERRRRARMRALVRDRAAAEFTVHMTDEVPRIPDARAAAARFAALVRDADLGGFAAADRALLRAGALAAPLAPRLVVPLVVRRLRHEADGVILSADDPAFGRHVARRRAESVRVNVNVLGEAILGDAEADRRLARVLERLQRPDVDYVSVKISSISAGVSALAFDATVARVADRLRRLYRTAAAFEPAKFVNLDMEEYRDLDLTLAAFRTVLDEEEFAGLDAGIVLQAYLPDAAPAARDLAAWAQARHVRAGGRIKVRVVKGANLAMERVDAELHGWERAPYDTKHEVDASYKAVLDTLLDPAFDGAVRIGVASHNLFDVAWALGLRSDLQAAGRPDRIEIEMLEGMAPSQSAVVREHAGDLLLYAPVVTRSDFPAAIAYLVRRLDENTSSDNFLSHLFDLADDPERFAAEAERFAASARERHTVATGRRRSQVRSGNVEPTERTDPGGPFVNAPDTDWTHPANRAWIADALRSAPTPAVVPLIDDPAVVDAAVGAARSGVASWSARPVDERAAVIERVGAVIEAARGRILATMAADAGKTIGQGDPEVSEAVDFARYYARQALRLGTPAGATPAPLGVVAITPPWNFPFAIPAGGVLAALAAGNAVVLKPAPQSVATAALLAELCWAAGVPADALQFLPLADGEAGRRLVTHPDVAAVVLTGAHATAQMFLGWRPDLRLHAETSGKNALVIAASADVDRAVADLVSSAFGHAGQKCSAASLAIVEAPLYDDPSFLERVRDAAATLRVGPAGDLATDVGPLIDPPGETLERALTRLEPGESWLLAPECRSADRRLWSPGIRLGVRPGSWFARTECFGPVLGLIRADDLDHAIAIQNSTDFGLTAGLHALDPDAITTWTERVEAGNLYVNRGTTGAIVQRQPFGGWKRSVVGPTAKAGGPNYVATLAAWTDAGEPLDTVRERFDAWMASDGRAEHDPTGLAAERNVFRYRPLHGGVAVRVDDSVTERERALLTAAGEATGCVLHWSDAATEPADVFAARLAAIGAARVRLLGLAADTPDHAVRRAAHEAGVAVDDASPVGAAEVELPRWLREQSVTTTMHRHGRVSGTGDAGDQAVERR